MYYLKQMNKEYEKAYPIRSTETNLRVLALMLSACNPCTDKSGTGQCPNKNVIIEFYKWIAGNNYF